MDSLKAAREHMWQTLIYKNREGNNLKELLTIE